MILKLSRASFLTVTLLIGGGLVLTLFSVKRQVQELNAELANLNRSIIADERAIDVLHAEWSYLNNPRRLEDLATRHLGLEPVRPSQLSSLAALPMRPAPGAPSAAYPRPVASSVTRPAGQGGNPR